MIVCFFFAAIASGLANPEVQSKRVLVIHSFGSVAPPFTTHSIAFETELVEKIGERVDLDEVSLDNARYADSDMQEALVEYLQKRQAKWRPDLVVPIGSPAGIFVAQYRDRLFPNVPILYCGLDRRRLPADALEKNAAFVGEDFNLPGFVEDILQVQPATKNIAVVLGASPLEQFWGQAIRKAFAPFADRVNFIWLDNLPFEQMLDRVAKLPPDSYIFLALLLRDTAGVSHNADEALQRLHAVANAPINGIFQHQLGLGIVGGRLYQAETEGIESARLAVRVLNGEPASNFPPKLVGPLAPRYDWRELHRWKINEKNLPPDSTVLFRQPTFWEENRRWIILGLSILVVQSLLIFGLLANLIKRRRAEGSLAESEARFQTVADAAPIPIWITGPDKLCTFLNKAWFEFTGRRVEQDLGDGWSENIHPDDMEGSLTIYSEAFDARTPFHMSYRLKRYDGEYRVVTDSGVPRFGPHGTFRGYVGVCTDITDLVRQQKALHAFEERIALAAEAARLGVWELDTTTNEIWMSDEARSLFQFERDVPVTYADFQSRVHPEDRELRHATIQKTIETSGGQDTEYRTLLPGGVVRWISGRMRCVNDDSGKPTRLIAVSMDITDRKQAEEEARRRRQQINFLGRASLLGEMTASLAHELNQPLAAITTNANAGIRFIEAGKGDVEMLREILADVAQDARRAHLIVRNVRSAIKKDGAVRTGVSLNEVITNVTQMLQHDADARACDMHTSLADGLPTIQADPVQIQEVFINLINNAFDAMHATDPGRRTVQISTERQNGLICASVRDHGIGIDEDAGEHIFEQFFTTKKEGLGMGLSIVRSIIEAHGGKIGAENAAGGGARFYFKLPASNGDKP